MQAVMPAVQASEYVQKPRRRIVFDVIARPRVTLSDFWKSALSRLPANRSSLRLVRQMFAVDAPAGAEIGESAIDLNCLAAYGTCPTLCLCQCGEPGVQLLGNRSVIIFFHCRF